LNIGIIGNGRATKFWVDAWLDGCSLVELAPDLLQAVSRRHHKSRLVTDAIDNGRWIQDISGPRTVPVMVQFVLVFQKLQQVVLNPGAVDKLL
jgi:hypothetical protein